MLDPEARALLDLMDQATKAGRPKLESLPHAIGRAAVDKMSEDSEADPPEVASVVDGTLPGPAGAIRFRPTLGGVSQPELDRAACTGCSACVAPCPTHAIACRPSASVFLEAS